MKKLLLILVVPILLISCSLDKNRYEWDYPFLLDKQEGVVYRAVGAMDPGDSLEVIRIDMVNNKMTNYKLNKTDE